MNRIEAEEKMIIMGYEQPTAYKPYNSSNNVSEYKSYNSKDEENCYQSSKNNFLYLQSVEKEQEKEKEQDKNLNNYCVVCQLKKKYECDCDEFGEFICENEHVWWFDENGERHEGDPHND